MSTAFDHGFLAGLEEAAKIARRYAHSGQSTLRRQVCYAVERRITEELYKLQNNRRDESAP